MTRHRQRQPTKWRGSVEAWPVVATSKAREHFVYALVSTDKPSQVRYVGVSVQVSHRLDHHVLRGEPAVREWIASVHARGAYVEARAITSHHDRKAAIADERRWIQALTAQGHLLLNVLRPVFDEEMEKRNQRWHEQQLLYERSSKERHAQIRRVLQGIGISSAKELEQSPPGAFQAVQAVMPVVHPLELYEAFNSNL